MLIMWWRVHQIGSPRNSSRRAAKHIFGGSGTILFCSHQITAGVSRLMSSSTTSTLDSKQPQLVVEGAIDMLGDFASQLKELAIQVDRRHAIQTPLRTLQVSIAEAAIHSRDSTPEDFSTALAETMRETMMEKAKTVEADLRVLADQYTTKIQPQMEDATRICQETPCGGATWELDLSTLQERAKIQGLELEDKGSTQKVSLGDMEDTPCGRLQRQSLSFLETTFETKQQIVMASRARLLLELASELQAPLQHIRKYGSKEQNLKIRETFQAGIVPMPWIRTDAEYQQLLEIQKDFKMS